MNFNKVLSIPPPELSFGEVLFTFVKFLEAAAICIAAADGRSPPPCVFFSTQRAVVQAWAMAVIPACSLCWAVSVVELKGTRWFPLGYCRGVSHCCVRPGQSLGLPALPLLKGVQVLYCQ